MRKDASGMTFESFEDKIMSIREYENLNINVPTEIIQKMFQIGNINKC